MSLPYLKRWEKNVAIHKVIKMYLCLFNLQIIIWTTYFSSYFIYLIIALNRNMAVFLTTNNNNGVKVSSIDNLKEPK